MQFRYRIIDLDTGNAYLASGDFYSYRHFVGELVAMNRLWSGQLRFEEFRETSLTSEYELV